jgi:hypothetical protein
VALAESRELNNQNLWPTIECLKELVWQLHLVAKNVGIPEEANPVPVAPFQQVVHQQRSANSDLG